MRNNLHLFKSAAKIALDSIDISNAPVYDLIIATMRPTLKERVVENINRQTVKPNVVSIVVQNYTEEEIQYLKDHITNCNKLEIQVEDNPTIFGGERHNMAVTKCESDIIANFDDDDIYYPEYMRGMLYWQLQAGEGMASKGNIVARDESLGYIGWLLTELRMKDNVVGAGSCMIFPRSLFDKVGGFATVRQGYDAVFQRAVMDKGYTVKNADPFNFIYTRGRPEGNTWNPGRTGIRHNNITLEEVILTV